MNSNLLINWRYQIFSETERRSKNLGEPAYVLHSRFEPEIKVKKWQHEKC